MAEVVEVVEVVEKQVCSICKCMLTMDADTFKINRHGKFNKTCIRCSERRKVLRDAKRCEHNKLKHQCRQCDGSAFCIHDKIKTQCRACNGSAFCIHDKIKTQCRTCNGSAFCIHDRRKSDCRQCDGSAFCMHGKFKHHCIHCDIHGYISGIMQNNVKRLNIPKEEKLHYTDYYGCNAEEYKFYIDALMVDGYSWNNRDLWDLDHRIPLNYRNPETGELPTLEEQIARLHYTNTKPMWKLDNMRKASKFIG